MHRFEMVWNILHFLILSISCADVPWPIHTDLSRACLLNIWVPLLCMLLWCLRFFWVVFNCRAGFSHSQKHGMHQTIGASAPDNLMAELLLWSHVYKLANRNRFLIPTPKDVSFTLCHASTFRPWPPMIWLGVISSVTPNPE